MAPTKEQSCTGKKAYPTKADAEAAAAVARREWLGRYGVYRCKHCGAWHVGHTGRRHR